jgi:hypothetical protein
MSPWVAALLATALACGMVTGGIFLACDRATVAPRTWAKSVCTALAPWHTTVANLTEAAQQEIGKTGTPVQTKQTLTRLLGGAADASERARARIADAGVPNVDGGAVVATQFVTALTRARDAYGHARSSITGLDPGQAKPFYDAVADAFARLNDEYAASALDISSVGPSELRRSFDEVPECR